MTSVLRHPESYGFRKEEKKDIEKKDIKDIFILIQFCERVLNTLKGPEPGLVFSFLGELQFDIFQRLKKKLSEELSEETMKTLNAYFSQQTINQGLLGFKEALGLVGDPQLTTREAVKRLEKAITELIKLLDTLIEDTSKEN